MSVCSLYVRISMRTALESAVCVGDICAEYDFVEERLLARPRGVLSQLLRSLGEHAAEELAS